MPVPPSAALAVAVALCGGHPARADLAVVFADAADGQVIDIPVPLVESHLFGSEVGINGGFIYTTIFPFQLPPRPAGMVVGTAEFTSTVIRNFTTPGYHVDLYGLAPRAAPELLVTDGYAGPLDATATLIEDDYLRNENSQFDAWVSVSTSSGGSQALAAYLNEAYDLTGPGGYVFLRLSIDAAAPPNPTVYFVRNIEWTFEGFEPRPRILYEFITPPCAGDTDADGDVDFEDLNRVLEAWGAGDPAGDVDGSGFVDFDDLNEVLANWGCPDGTAAPR